MWHGGNCTRTCDMVEIMQGHVTGQKLYKDIWHGGNCTRTCDTVQILRKLGCANPCYFKTAVAHIRSDPDLRILRIRENIHCLDPVVNCQDYDSMCVKNICSTPKWMFIPNWGAVVLCRLFSRLLCRFVCSFNCLDFPQNQSWVALRLRLIDSTLLATPFPCKTAKDK